MIETPVAFPAENNIIGSLISELESAPRIATLQGKEMGDQEKALATFGLKPAKIKLKLREGDKTYQLILGNETARAGFVYALINDGEKEEVAIIEKNLETLLAKGLNDWRDRKIFNFLTVDVSSLNLRKDEAETELVKEGEFWKISKPLMTSADENEVASFLANLSSARASGFVADNAADIGAYGLSSPALVLDVSQGEKKDIIRVGSELPEEKGFYYAQMAGRPTVFKINQGLYQQIAGMTEKLRDRRLFVLRTTETIQKLKIEKGDLILDLSAKAGGVQEWELLNSGGRLADPEKVQAFVESLKLARAESFQPVSDDLKKKAGLVKPAWKVTFDIKDGKGEVLQKVLQFSLPKKGEIFVETAFRTGIVSIQEGKAPLLPQAAYEWFGKFLNPPFEGSPDFLKWDKGSQISQLNKTKEGDWPKEMEGKAIERTILDRQLQVLAGIRLREWTPVTDKTFGIPYLRLTYGQGESKRVLEFGKEIETGLRQARIQGEPLAFIMSNEDYLLLNIIPVKDETPQAAVPR
jgi:hypothetical protein